MAAVGLVLEFSVREVRVAQTLVPFVVMSVVIAIVLWLTGARWLRGAVATPQPLPRDAVVEGGAAVWRRAAIEVSLVALLMLAGISAGRGVGAVIAGVAAGTGLVNVLSARWVRAREGDARVRLVRETPARLVSSGRRPVYSARG